MVKGLSPAVSHPGEDSARELTHSACDSRLRLFPHRQNGDKETTYPSGRLPV